MPIQVLKENELDLDHRSQICLLALGYHSVLTDHDIDLGSVIQSLPRLF